MLKDRQVEHLVALHTALSEYFSAANDALAVVQPRMMKEGDDLQILVVGRLVQAGSAVQRIIVASKDLATSMAPVFELADHFGRVPNANFREALHEVQKRSLDLGELFEARKRLAGQLALFDITAGGTPVGEA